MFPLEEQIEQKIKEALKAREQLPLNAYRLLKASIKNERIRVGKNFSEADLIKVLRSELKKRQEAAEAFSKGGRAEQAAQELTEAKIIKSLLPLEISEEKIIEIINQVIKEQPATSQANFGQIMKIVMSKLAGQAAGSLVSRLVKEQLAK